jgi:hypothetical protein
MTALALRLRGNASAHWLRGPLCRMIAGGTLSGLLLSGGLLALTYQSCGLICPADALVTTGLSIGAAILTIAPVTVLDNSRA